MASVADSSFRSSLLSDIYEEDEEPAFGFVTVIKKSGKDGGVYQMNDKDVIIGR